MAAQLTSTISWTSDDVRAFLRLYGRAPERLDVHQLRSWWSNTVLRVDADGEQLVLRRYGLTPAEEVPWELALLSHLNAHGFPTIAPLTRATHDRDSSATHRRQDGGPDGPYGPAGPDAYLADFLGGPAILYPFIVGHNPSEGRVEWGRAIAQTVATIARLHELTVGLTLPHPRVRSGTDSRRLLRELLEYAATRPIASPDAALQDLLLRVERTEHELGQRIAAYASHDADLPRGIVHHDAHQANVLFRGDRLVALIDFDDACEGFLLADLSAMVANWSVTSQDQVTLNLDWAAVVIHEYERHRPLTAAERDLLPDFVAAFLLADAAAYVRDRLEQGADGDTAVRESTVYRRSLHHAGDPTRLRQFRQMLTRRPS